MSAMSARRYFHSPPGGFLIFGLFLSLFTLLALVTQGTAHAANTGTYPYNDGNPWDAGHHYAISANFGDWAPKPPDNNGVPHGNYNCRDTIYPPGGGHPYQDPGACETILPAATTRYKLFRTDSPGNTPTDLFITDGCKDVDNTAPFDKPSRPNKGARTIDVEIHQTKGDGSIGDKKGPTYNNYSGDCQGTTLKVSVPASAFTKNQQNRFGTKVYTALVVIYKHQDLPGNKVFRLVYGSGAVYGDDKSQYALSDDRQGDTNPTYNVYTTYSFKFVTDCTYKEGTTVYLGADALNVGNESIQGKNIDLYIQAPGSTTRVKKSPQNNKYNLGVLQPRQPYTLWLVNVGVNNGIKVTLPYGEYEPPPDSNCPKGNQSATGACVRTRVQDDGTTKYNGKDAASITQVDISPISDTTTFKDGDGGDGGGGGNVNNAEVGSGHSKDVIWKYAPAGPDVTVTIRHLVKPQGASKYTNIGTDVNTVHCNDTNNFHASCTIDSIEPEAAAANPYDLVLVNYNFIVSVTVTNDGAFTLPATLGGHPFSLNSGDEAGNGSDWGGIEHHLGALDPDNSTTVQLTLSAGSAIANKTLKLHPAYSNLFAFTSPSACATGVNIYQHFNITPKAELDPSINQENPYIPGTTNHGVRYSFGGSLSEGPATTATTSGWLSKQPPGAGAFTVDGVHVTSDSYGSVSYTHDYLDSGFSAGTQYCPHVTINPANGYRGFSADVGDQAATVDGACITITNKPYFKTFGGSMSARNGTTPLAGVCSATSANSGLLAGWNDNADFGAERGAGSQLASIALINITGVASAQTVNDITRSPTELSFANNNPADISSSGDSPGFGGNFGGAPACASPPTVASGSTIGGTVSVPASGSYQRTGNLTLNGGTVTGKTAIYVNGDVLINGDITYGANPSWTNSGNGVYTGSEFLIVATGDISIAPGVSRLDGSYVAQPKDATHGGTIYTCSPGIGSPGASYDFYHNCNYQLLVNGIFAADNVKMLRSFGSLRDEEPNPPTAGGGTLGLIWSCGGSSCNPSTAGYTCTQIDEPSDPDTWNDNRLCLPNSSSLSLAWTHNSTNPSAAGPVSWYPVSYLQTHGYPYCTQWDVPADYANTWGDNALCMSQHRSDGTALLHFETSAKPGQDCTRVYEPVDAQGQWASGYYLCAPIASPTPPTPKGPPYTSCSNSGRQVDTHTCAAEVFQFSPELYLVNPNPTIQGSGSGALQYDSITGLPPVL